MMFKPDTDKEQYCRKNRSGLKIETGRCPSDKPPYYPCFGQRFCALYVCGPGPTRWRASGENVGSEGRTLRFFTTAIATQIPRPKHFTAPVFFICAVHVQHSVLLLLSRGRGARFGHMSNIAISKALSETVRPGPLRATNAAAAAEEAQLLSLCIFSERFRVSTCQIFCQSSSDRRPNAVDLQFRHRSVI